VKVGDLVRVRNLSTGDEQWMARCYRERTPMLLMELRDLTYTFAKVSVRGEFKWLRSSALAVISESA